MSNKRKILVTGSAGFIGYHTCMRLLKEEEFVIGFDNINNYYDVRIKKARLNDLELFSKKNNFNWKFIKGNLEDQVCLKKLFSEYNPEIVIHLAAQAGVRHSKKEPIKYLNSNIIGFVNILECCKEFPVKNFIYASSSSVYGVNQKLPFIESEPASYPASLYAATKRSNELIAHSYSHIYNIPCIGLRFFTVYGPWGRPDMAPMIFTKAIFSGKPIEIFNNGEMSRDFTYIDDVIEILNRIKDKPPLINKNTGEKYNYENVFNPYLIFNIGCSQRIKLLRFVEILEEEIGVKAKKILLPMFSGDVKDTYSNNRKISQYTNYEPQISINEGINRFIKWYKYFYKKIN